MLLLIRAAAATLDLMDTATEPILTIVMWQLVTTSEISSHIVIPLKEAITFTLHFLCYEWHITLNKAENCRDNSAASRCVDEQKHHRLYLNKHNGH